jgi:AcrR family transcriptional regulator
MSRPAGDSEQKLMQAAKAILQEQGLGGLSVRAVAKLAGVNVGMVSYHFGGMEALTRRALQEVYEEFFKDFSLLVDGETDPLAALRAALLRLARFSRDHRKMVISLLRDLLAERPEARKFAFENMPRHGKVISGLLRQCMAKGRLAKHDMGVAMPMIMGSLALPNLMVDGVVAMAPKLPFKMSARLIEKHMISDTAQEKRVDLVLKALKP